MKKYIVLMISLMIIGCSKEKENEDAFNLDVGVEFSIVNLDGEDILNPNHPNGIKESDIKLFYLVDGVKEEVYHANYDYPRNFMIFEHQNEFRIRIFQNHADNEDKPITYIQWNDIDTDTIETTYERTSNAVLQRKIWLNGNLLWDSNSGIEPFFVITK